MYNITIRDTHGNTQLFTDQTIADLKAWLNEDFKQNGHIESITKIIEMPIDVETLRFLADGFINKTP